MLSCAWQAGLDPSLGGLDFVASHFHKVAQVCTLAMIHSKCKGFKSVHVVRVNIRCTFTNKMRHNSLTV